MAEDAKHLYIDFDGVLHRYNSGWQGAGVIPDDPVVDEENGRDAIQWLTSLCQSGHFVVHIFSRRGSDPSNAGVGAMKMWLMKHGMPERYLKRLKFETQKPDMWLLIDDRCMQFDGAFPDPLDIKNFKPWWKNRDA